jgi:conjugative relaxase-like TrwC/TraI family protein
MLSTQNISTSQQASHYFLGADNYYTQENAKEHSGWWGKGAETLGLSGMVEPEKFSHLLEGKMPDGQQLGVKEGDKITHRPGFDLTFSVPKSVSLAALLGGDERIVEATLRAVDKTLAHIETDCAQARITQKGVTSYEMTKNLVVANFLHDISREADPQLHVHSVVMNMTQRADGQWRSLASQSGAYGAGVSREVKGFIEQVRHHKHYYGTLFGAELAYEMQQLGYSIEKTGKDGQFELDGISQASRDTFSTRRKQITDYMTEFGFSSSKAAALATLATRKRKQSISRDSLQELWENRNETANTQALTEAKSVVEKARYQAVHPDYRPEQPQLIASQATKEALLFAIDHLSETHTALSEMQLLNVALNHVIGENANTAMMGQALKDAVKEGVLLPTNSHHNQKFFTTSRLIHQENLLLSAVMKAHPNGKAIATESLNRYLLQRNDILPEQEKAIRTLFSSDKQITCLEGREGSGKTTVMKHLVAIAKHEGYHTVVLTPNKAGSQVLQHEYRETPTSLLDWVKQRLDTHRPTQFDTVSHFVKAQEKAINTGQGLPQKTMIFVDNATVLSTQQMHDLVSIIQHSQAYLIPVGDKKSLLPYQAGTPFTQMLEKGAVCATLITPLRAHSKPVKEAIEDTLQGNIRAAFAKVGERIKAIEEKDERLQHIANQVADLSLHERNNTLVLMPTKAQCEEMNTSIRNELIKRGVVENKGLSVDALIPKSFTKAQYRHVAHYREGDVVRFNENYASLQVKRGDYRKINAIHADKNTLVLEDAQGEKITWNPDKVAGRAGSIEVFEEKKREFAVGESLLWKRNLSSHGIHNGEQLRVEAIKDQSLVLSRQPSTITKNPSFDKKTLTVEMNAPEVRHVDYGYASTPYQKHYATTKRVIAYQSGHSRQSHQRVFYKELSQATDEAWIMTDDKEKLLEQVQKHTGDKVTALSVLAGGRFDNMAASKSIGSEGIAQTTVSSQQKLSPEELASNAVRYALSHLSERETGFTQKELYKVASHHVLGKIESKKITEALGQAEKDGQVIQGKLRNAEDELLWTTPEAIAIEREIVALLKHDHDQLPPLAGQEAVEQHLREHPVKTEQAEAVRLFASNQDRITLLQGFAGTGKTTLLKNVQTLLQSQDQVLLCLAPTHVAVKELKARGLPAQTVDSFLIEHQKQCQAKTLTFYQNNLVIAVDEASMASNRRYRDVCQSIHAREARGLIVGDRQQLSAIESGKPFELSQKTPTKTLYLTEIERQKNPLMQKAVKETYQGDFAAAFTTLADHVVELGKEVVDGKDVDNRSVRLAFISDNYCARTKTERDSVLIITLGNDDRVELNTVIRKGLKKNGELSGQDIKVEILTACDMTEIERTHVANYEGDCVRFHFNAPQQGIHKDHYYTIVGRDKAQNRLELQHEQSKRVIVWEPQPLKNTGTVGAEVYKKEEREITSGDRIRWTRSDKKLGLFSPELADVISVSDERIELQPLNQTKNSERIIIHPCEAKYQHWDHAYAMTTYSSQARTVNEAILHAESFRTHLASQRSFLVGLTRVVNKVTLVTNDQEALSKKIVETPGDKTSSLEVIGEITFPLAFTSQQAAESTITTRSESKKPISSPAPQQEELRFEAKPSEKEVTTASKSQTNPAKKPGNTHGSRKPHLDAARIVELLNERVESVLEVVMGAPKQKLGNHYCYGNKEGSLKVTVKGDKRGLWHDFATGEGGNLLHLIAKESGLDRKADFRAVLDHALSLLGTPAEQVMQQDVFAKKTKVAPLSDPNPPRVITPEEKERIQYAKNLARQSQPIQGTLAERYLREHRGINLKEFPSSVRYHPGIRSKKNGGTYPAVLVIGTHKNGEIEAVQAIYLDKKTGGKADVSIQKQTWGVPKLGSAVALTHLLSEKSAPIFIAEGPETGLSIYQSIPGAHVKVTLGKGNFRNIDPKSLGNDVVLCTDNDNDEKKEVDIHLAAERLIAHGKNVWIAKPNDVKDYNDVLQKHGANAVKTNIENAILYADYQAKTLTSVTLKSEVLDKQVTADPTKEAIDTIAKQLVKEKENLSETFGNIFTDLRACAGKIPENKMAETSNNFIKKEWDLAGEIFNTIGKNLGKGEQDYSKQSPTSHAKTTTEGTNNSREDRKISDSSVEQKQTEKRREKEPEL